MGDVAASMFEYLNCEWCFVGGVMSIGVQMVMIFFLWCGVDSVELLMWSWCCFVCV